MRSSPEPWTAPWFAALIENARDNADELRRIDSHLRRTKRVGRRERWRLRRRIRTYARTAAPEPRADSELTRRLRECDLALHDTTGYDDPVTTITFIPDICRRSD